MTWRRVLRGAAYEWLCALLCFSLLVAPFGCQLQARLFEDLADALGGGSDAGLFINSDHTSPLLAGGRNAAGDAFFVFGTRTPDGGIDEIESILVRESDGKESFVAFESGRPVHVQAPDGSYAHATYTDVSPERLAATVELFNAADGSRSTYDVEIDLQQAAEEVAAALRAATGRDVPVTEVDSAGKASHPADKPGAAQVRITVLSPLFTGFVAPLLISVGLMTIMLGQIVIATYAAVAVALQAVVLAIFAPFFLIAELLSDAIVRIELTPLTLIFASLPPPPVVILR